MAEVDEALRDLAKVEEDYFRLSGRIRGMHEALKEYRRAVDHERIHHDDVSTYWRRMVEITGADARTHVRSMRNVNHEAWVLGGKILEAIEQRRRGLTVEQ